MKWLTCLLLLIGVGRAQIAGARAASDAAEYWVQFYAARYRVPVELVEAIIDQESGWNPCLVSSKGAAGIMQLMPQTAIRFGVHNRFAVEDNIRGGVAYLAWLAGRFDGDFRLVTAAYYAGEEAIAARGLAYSSPDVHAYVSRIARGYRSRRLLHQKSEMSTALWKAR